MNLDPEAESYVRLEQRADLPPGQHTVVDDERKTVIAFGPRNCSRTWPISA